MTSDIIIPKYSWNRELDNPFTTKIKGVKIRLKDIFHLFPAIIRMYKKMRLDKKQGKESMNLFSFPKASACHGVPIGGLGGGTIGRGWRGEFYRWQLKPGVYHHNSVETNQFSVFIKSKDGSTYSTVLNPNHPRNSKLNGWNWDFYGKNAVYHALYPRAWTEYNNIQPGINLICKQISPVIPHNYEESSYPVGVFVWYIENSTDEPVEVSIMFSFQNGTGTENDFAGGHKNEHFEYELKKEKFIGVRLNHVHRQKKPLKEGQKLKDQEFFEDSLQFAIATRDNDETTVTCNPLFFTNSNGGEVWETFEKSGEVNTSDSSYVSKKNECIGAAIASKVTIPAKELKELSFTLAWDMPLARFGGGRAHYRRYTRFYGRKGNNAHRIAADALLEYPEWEKQIEKWQKPILEDETLPAWYKVALFNELYYIADGGTIWTDGEEGEEPFPEKCTGHFSYLEGHQYTMYNTYDVHFYASFALAMLWPELELSLQRDFAEAVLTEKPETHLIFGSGSMVKRNIKGVVPHDLGAPFEDPWYLVNVYALSDHNKWKDLNPKFVLQIYRDYIATGNKKFLEETWEAVKLAIEFIQVCDSDGDGLIENAGFPDQTYDLWSVFGPSAYTGGLWLACLTAAAAIADILKEKKKADYYRQILIKGKQAYEEKLWNGSYYNYDSSKSRQHNSIMADQLAGQWYAQTCSLPSIVPKENARKALKTVYDFNVMRFKEGKMGAVNGMRPNGAVDKSCLQSSEVWTGTTYALAAAMLQLNLEEEAFKTAKGIYETGWKKLGYWFQTPEAWDSRGGNRSLAYMRPLSIWAIQWVIEKLLVVTKTTEVD